MGQANKYKYKNNMCKVLSREEWDRLNSYKNQDEVNAAKCQRAFEENEKIKQESYEIQKFWTNTDMGSRNKKLDARKERLRREEEERVAIDQEWAKQQAEERRQKLCLARTLQLYTVPRIQSFYSAVQIGDVMKENELQLKLKELKREAAAKKSKIEFEAMKKSIKEAEEEELKKSAVRRAAERAVREEQFKQIEEHRQLEAKEKAELIAEGEKIRQLAREAEDRNRQLREEKCRLQQKTANDQLKEIEYKKKWLQMQRIKEEEENTRELLFATAKRKIGKVTLEKDAAAKAARDAVQEKMVDYLAQQIQKEKAYRESSIRADVEVDNTRWNDRVEDETRKKESILRDIEAHRIKILKENEELRIRQAEEAKAELRSLQELDEKNRREDEERKAQKREKSRELVQLYLEEMKRHEEERVRAREEDVKFLKQTEEQEEIFQNYAQRAIKSCEDSGIPTYAMKKVANQKSNDGFGIGVLETDKNVECEFLPDLPPHKVNLCL